jgi:hypothetical protein
MSKNNWIIVIVAIALWAMLPRGLARAQETIGDIDFYVNYSTGVSPFTWTTVNSNSGTDQ